MSGVAGPLQGLHRRRAGSLVFWMMPASRCFPQLKKDLLFTLHQGYRKIVDIGAFPPI